MVSRFTIILLLVAFLNALCFPLITLGLTHVSHMTFATLRAVSAGLVLGVVAIMLGHLGVLTNTTIKPRRC